MENLGHIYDQERIIEEMIKRAKEKRAEQIIKNLRKMGVNKNVIKVIRSN